MTDHPCFVMIQYWNPMTADWEVGHAGINLLSPAAYVRKLSERGVVARAVDKESGDIVYGEGADLL